MQCLQNWCFSALFRFFWLSSKVWSATYASRNIFHIICFHARGQMVLLLNMRPTTMSILTNLNGIGDDCCLGPLKLITAHGYIMPCFSFFFIRMCKQRYIIRIPQLLLINYLSNCSHCFKFGPAILLRILKMIQSRPHFGLPLEDEWTSEGCAFFSPFCYKDKEFH